MPQPDRLTRLYVEITSSCNLDCQMCVRRAWNEPLGDMPLEVFADLMGQLRSFDPVPTVHLGGYGEPTQHPDLLDIVQLAGATGARVEMTTNGTRLTAELSRALIERDIDRIVVSIDGVTAEGYEQIRTFSSFDMVIENLRDLKRLKLRINGRRGKPEIGLAFVAMQRNVGDLPRLPMLAAQVGASSIQVSNVVPHTPEMEAEILYRRSLNACGYRASPWVPDLSLPKLDLNGQTLGVVGQVFASPVSISLLDAGLSERANYCRFAQEGYAAVRWDGELAPCLPLLHDHPVYLRQRRHEVTHHSFGNIRQTDLAELWSSPEYASYRRTVRDFPYSPCTTCGGCDLFAQNLYDCSENSFPVCGRCLWAQGYVQCP